MSNRAYDTLRLIALVATPVSVLIVSVLSAINIPQLDIVTAILAAVDTFLGALVEIARREYNKEWEAEG